MNRRSAFALLLIISSVFPPLPALAQGNGNNGNGNGNGNSGNGNGNSGNANDNGNGNGNGNTDGAGNGTTVADPTAAAEGGELSDGEVLAAVDAGRAVSLEAILPDLRSRTGGEIIDAKLQQAQGFLLYVVTVLTPDGKVITEYYYARSGLHVER